MEHSIKQNLPGSLGVIGGLPFLPINHLKTSRTLRAWTPSAVASEDRQLETGDSKTLHSRSSRKFDGGPGGRQQKQIKHSTD